MNGAEKTERSNTSERVCPSCGQANPATAGICWRCGRSIHRVGNGSSKSDASSGKSSADAGGKPRSKRN